MHATIFQNPLAGLQPPPLDSLLNLLQKEGFTTTCLESVDTHILEEEARKKVDLIVLVGGDGTIRHFVKHFHPIEVPLLIIPTGTANNIARSLRLSVLPRRVDLDRPGALIPFHTGKVDLEGRTNFFLESTGAGMIARMMVLMHFRKMSDPYFFDYQQEKYRESLHLLRGVIHSQSAHPCRLLIDGVDYSGKYLFVEVMNIPMIGPNIALASQTDPGDGYLRVVWLRPEDRSAFERELLRRLNGEPYSLELPSRRCRSVELTWEGANVHVDGEAYKDYDNETLRLSVSPQKLHFYRE